MRSLTLALCLLAGVAAVAEAYPPRQPYNHYRGSWNNGGYGFYYGYRQPYWGPPTNYPGYHPNYFDKKAEYLNRRGPYGPYYGPPQYRYNW